MISKKKATGAVLGAKASKGVARGAGKAVGGAGRTLLGGSARGKVARKAARGAGKRALRGGVRAVTPREPASTRFLKYGIFAFAGFAVGALVARSGSSAGQRDETWGSGVPTGTAGGSSPAGAVSDPARPQRPEDPNRTGTEREYSDPSSGPLIGRRHDSGPPEIPVQHEEIENRIRTRIGEDPRTMHLAHLNVEVNDDVADIRGQATSEEEKRAVGEITEQIEGVREVRNLITVNPDAPTRGDKAAGQDLPPPRDQ